MAVYSLNGDDWKLKAYLGEDWVWRNGEKRNTGDVRFWKAARVPGCVTDDMYRSGEIPDPYYEKNSLLIEWIPERTWVYRIEFFWDGELEQKKVYLCFQGVDYDARFYFNDVYLGEHHSMFTPVRFDVTGLIVKGEKNLVSVVLSAAPGEQPQVSKTRYVKTHKSRMPYWWDFCPRMIHLGIWDDVYLDITGGASLSRPDIEVRLSQDFSAAQVTARASLSAPAEVCACLAGPDGSVLERQTCMAGQEAVFSFRVEKPELWQPNGCGGQPLYRLVLSAADNAGISDEKRLRFGIRDVKFVPNETSDATARPYTARVNGRKIFMRGYNWVPVDVMYGVRRPEKLRRLIGLLKEANVNCLRIWGGGLIEREDFYDLCDENGIMLWQEFIQSSSGIENEPSRDPSFICMMAKEAGQIIRQKKHHPSLVIWGGGNELSGPDNAMLTMEEPVIAALAGQAARLDPSRYFLESSPTGRVFNNTYENIVKDPEGLHDVHGPWEHQGLTEQYTLYNAGTSLLSSEFGVEGMTGYETLSKGMDESHMWPPSRDNEYYFHRGSWWNNYPLLQECFGNRLDNIRDTVRASQFMQYEGLKYAVEANRRRALTLSGVFPWQFNEPYPNNTCTCNVDYYAQPKPAYYGVKKAYERDTVTARFESQTLSGRETFSASVFFQSQEPDRMPAFVQARVADEEGNICLNRRIFCQKTAREAEKAVWVADISCAAGDITGAVFYLLLDALDEEENNIAQNRYLFTATDLSPLLTLPETRVWVRFMETEGGPVLLLTNTGRTAAAGLWLEDASGTKGEETGYLSFENNYYYLMPSETVRCRVKCTKGKRPAVRISAFNLRETVAEPDADKEQQ